MIIVRLKGGLGNQMFQYAAARRLAHHHNTELKLDLSFLEGDQKGCTRRSFELCHFCIQAEIATSFEIAQLTESGKQLLKNIVARFYQVSALAQYNSNVYFEPHFHFDPTILNMPDNTLMDGYWQSELYFIDIADIIHHEFRFSSDMKGENQAVAEEILGVNAVSLHVRRGDYVQAARISARHNICDLDYYLRAEEFVMQHVKSPVFYVFSDDPEWVKDNLALNSLARYVNHNNTKGYEDLRLMSLCKHHIIANSSFSWWGAWLSTNSNKLVVAPTRWFSDTTTNTSDLIPRSWQCL